ncbi:MAG: HRDC domain-containing protein, partial [Gemmataceae bacterium]
VRERFGINHILKILRGRADDQVRRYGHDKLSVFGLLDEVPETDLRDWIYQLIGQGALYQTEDEFPKLKLTELAWQLMRNQRDDIRLVRLTRRKKGERPARALLETTTLQGIDPSLLSALRVLRKQLADERGKPAFVIFNDLTLRELARKRPGDLSQLRQVTGIGEAKVKEYGEAILQVIHRQRVL